MGTVTNDFYEDDEPAQKIHALFTAGSKQSTERPQPSWVLVEPVPTVGVGILLLPQRAFPLTSSVITSGAPIPA